MPLIKMRGDGADATCLKHNNAPHKAKRSGGKTVNRISALVLSLSMTISFGIPQPIEAKGNYRHELINLGAARTQRKLFFYPELPEDGGDLARLRVYQLPCGTPLIPAAYQIGKVGGETMGFLSFRAPHLTGHILVDEEDRERLDLLDYFLFDSRGTPFCESKLEQTLSQCGSVGVILSYNSHSVLEATIENLSSNQFLFLDWNGASLIGPSDESPVLPSDYLIQAVELDLRSKANSLLYQVHPLMNLVMLGLGTRSGFQGFAADTTEQDLVALWELTKKVDIDVGRFPLEALGPKQIRKAPLSIRLGQGWKTSGLLLPTTRGQRYTLSLPVARSTLAAGEKQTKESEGSEKTAPPRTIVQTENLQRGSVEFSDTKPAATERCAIVFRIP